MYREMDTRIFDKTLSHCKYPYTVARELPKDYRQSYCVMIKAANTPFQSSLNRSQSESKANSLGA